VCFTKSRFPLRLIPQCVKNELLLSASQTDCRPQLKDTRTPTECSAPLNSPQLLPQFFDNQSAESSETACHNTSSPNLRIANHNEQSTTRSACQHLRIPPATRPQIFPITTTKYENCRGKLLLPRPVRSIQLEKPRETRKHRPRPIFWQIRQIY
jgi:hypothetical protein